MTKRSIYILIITLLSITSYSCASFSKNRFRKEIDNLKEKDISKLNGTYSFYPIRRYYNLGREEPYDRIPDSLKYNNAYEFLVNDWYQKKKEFDSLRKEENKYQLNLNLEKRKNRLNIKVFENSKVIKDTILIGRYKKGMFYLDNKYVDCTGIPFLFGGCSNNKRRIGVTQNGNLLINEASSDLWAILIILGNGKSYNETYQYKRE